MGLGYQIFPISRVSRSEFATTLLPGQDETVRSSPLSGVFWFVVSCGVMLSDVVVGEVPKPRVTQKREVPISV